MWSSNCKMEQELGWQSEQAKQKTSEAPASARAVQKSSVTSAIEGASKTAMQLLSHLQKRMSNYINNNDNDGCGATMMM